MFLIKGLLVGFCVASPIGPMAILCMRYTLMRGWMAGFLAGLGITVADGFYAWTAAVSSNIINSWIKNYETYFHYLGGALLMAIGLSVFRTSIQKNEPSQHESNIKHVKIFITTLFLTLASPMTAFLFLAFFTGYGVFEDTPLTSLQTAQLVTGVCLGSLAWWAILVSFAHFLKKKYDLAIFKYFNKIAGVIIFGFGLYTISKRIFFL